MVVLGFVGRTAFTVTTTRFARMGRKKSSSWWKTAIFGFAAKIILISDELSGETIVLMLFDSSSIWGVIYHDILLGTIDAKKKVMLYKQFPVLINQEMQV